MQQTRPLCLASTSPRRRELLERYGLRFSIHAPQVDEAQRPGEAPEAFVMRLAADKALAARPHVAPDCVVLAGDTIVLLDGEILGKPADPDEAEQMLRSLSGRSHEVLSGYSLLDAQSGEQIGRSVRTRVEFRTLPADWLRWYSRQQEAADKAGGYGIQGIGGAMVSGIEGSYTNVMGFPIEEVIWELLERGWLKL